MDPPPIQGVITKPQMNREPQLDALQWEKIAGHWPLAIPGLILMVGSQVIPVLLKCGPAGFLLMMNGGLGLMITGAVLIGWAKFPAYLAGRILSWGIGSVPPTLASHYRWGGGVFLVGLAVYLLALLFAVA